MTSSQPEIVLGNEPSDRVVIIDDRSILSASPLTVVDIADFLACEFPPRANLLAPWLPRQGLAMIHARRGVGKTHIALGIASAVA